MDVLAAGRRGARAMLSQRRSLSLRIAGYVLIGAGIILILLCVPFWAWLALIGAALILLGLLLIRKK